MKTPILPLLSSCAAAALFAGPAPAQIQFTLTFDDPQSLLVGHESQIESSVLAAAALWARHLDHGGRQLELSIQVIGTTQTDRGFGRSTTSGFVANRNGFDIFEQGAAYEIRTGIDPNGAAHDIEIGLNPTYVSDELWFDPAPTVRTAPVPSNRTDAVSVMLHELGHALAFNGWLNGLDGALPGNYKSTWDELVVFDGLNSYFTGPAAVAHYGGPVPVTHANPNHLGNNALRPGSDLIPTLMNGVVFFRGTRYDIGPVELAVFQDVGISLRDPCPADLDDDDDADVFDLLTYLDAWFAADPAAERTGDSQINVFDLLAYLDVWFTGC